MPLLKLWSSVFLISVEPRSNSSEPSSLPVVSVRSRSLGPCLFSLTVSKSGGAVVGNGASVVQAPGEPAPTHSLLMGEKGVRQGKHPGQGQLGSCFPLFLSHWTEIWPINARSPQRPRVTSWSLRATANLPPTSRPYLLCTCTAQHHQQRKLPPYVTAVVSQA